MIYFWHRLFVSALVIMGIWNAFRKEMVFGVIGEWAANNAPQWLYKPTIGCPPCMASLQGSWLWFYLGGGVYLWPVFVLALSGLMKLVVIHSLSR